MAAKRMHFFISQSEILVVRGHSYTIKFVLVFFDEVFQIIVSSSFDFLDQIESAKDSNK